jgi:lipopolysaccharide transport system ATP-binding protein
MVTVENLSKQYPLRHSPESRGGLTFRDMLASEIQSAVRRFSHGAADFWRSNSQPFRVLLPLLPWRRGPGRGGPLPNHRPTHPNSPAASRLPSPHSDPLHPVPPQPDDARYSTRVYPAQETFWALRDVSFHVAPGEVVGIIGRNGAGKSTLLKILSRIAQPTCGRIRLRGRVASLLEVGTGFHPELTGRENIFLNGAILGLTRAEIKGRFNDIVAFAEVARFLDTPVKRYSSGMYLRLAFAVAAHLEPEILIIDEVLAVGDAAFQQKCLGKMKSVSRAGRTILFVSHQLNLVQNLCTRVVWLESGQVQATGNPQEILSRYLEHCRGRRPRYLESPLDLGSLRLERFQLTPNPVESGADLSVDLHLRAQHPLRLTDLAVLLCSPEGQRLAVLDLRASGLPAALSAGQTWHCRCRIPALPMVEGEYPVGLYLRAGDFHGDRNDLVTLAVHPRSRAHGAPPFYPARHRGFLELDPDFVNPSHLA